MKTTTLAPALLAGVSLPALADPSDVDEWGNPVGYVEIENAPVDENDFANAVLDLAMQLKAGSPREGRLIEGRAHSARLREPT